MFERNGFEAISRTIHLKTMKIFKSSFWTSETILIWWFWIEGIIWRILNKFWIEIIIWFWVERIIWRIFIKLILNRKNKLEIDRVDGLKKGVHACMIYNMEAV